jgi:hypothetical protein
MNEPERAVLLRHAEPARLVRHIRLLVHAGCDLLLEHVDDFVEEAGRDQDVLVNPRRVCHCWDFDRQEVVVLESTSLSFRPSERILVDLKDVRRKLCFFGPEELELVQIELVEAFLCEAHAGCELGREGREHRKGEKGVLGSPPDDSKILGKGSSNWVDLFGNFLVC